MNRVALAPSQEDRGKQRGKRNSPESQFSSLPEPFVNCQNSVHWRIFEHISLNRLGITREPPPIT